MLKCEGVSVGVIAVKDRPSSCNAGGGKAGGGVIGLVARDGDDALEDSSPLDCEGSPSSGTVFLLEDAEG